MSKDDLGPVVEHVCSTHRYSWNAPLRAYECPICELQEVIVGAKDTDGDYFPLGNNFHGPSRIAEFIARAVISAGYEKAAR